MTELDNQRLEDRLEAFVSNANQDGIQANQNMNQYVPRTAAATDVPDITMMQEGESASINGSSMTSTTQSIPLTPSYHAASASLQQSQSIPGFQSVRDRIAQYKAASGPNPLPAATSARFNTSTHALSGTSRRESLGHRDRPRLSQNARSAPYPCKPIVSGNRESVTHSHHTSQLDISAHHSTGADTIAATLQPLSIGSNSQGSLQPKQKNVQPGGSPNSATRGSNEHVAAKYNQTAASTNKCQACSKTVYAMEQVTVDTHMFHRTCFKCAHCKGQLKMGNLASMGGVYYCKPHFKQLFALKGNYSEGFGKEEPKRAWMQEHGTHAPK
ncbi:hypothetical protein BATDEDRAFT_34089 [Batrachochytrium dendrobatidis JAM81]|uniref:LIM zinc-binding domain-containing protein n=2 Tax=Batrachochytrium dendrobatidis TaxID=109871 RepID=F4NVI3_BATDJ|nr:uncharacterized protein BATDEDRAFT_34089 [Batrachochytrium dendrobatidis JAM81]EGF83272.1 hypothetical protein BATDEDRAFT_34089 [Batrachochytrium dendrobatidis JAM81]KAK5671497.1 hypothetical protein QVD99_002203 [Batrachochytrium dendrobatidis]OAJ36604.1 hypothetical protein BDEG_20762 [Batrachochytrium dendrobatidis JEL423]|eukprot:XP_006675747.1 hypothetical protein BATDEDRAFT_34089 [Batrachochytrium dendrobatidis JAM81]